MYPTSLQQCFHLVTEKQTLDWLVMKVFIVGLQFNLSWRVVH